MWVNWLSEVREKKEREEGRRKEEREGWWEEGRERERVRDLEI